MNVPTESPLLAETERPAASVQNAGGTGDVVLVCEHASAFIPAALNELGLGPDAQASHVAWDIGAMALAEHLMRLLDAPLVASRVSRLVYDCNRPPEAPDAIPAVSERFAIPGNESLTSRDKAARVREVYDPFRAHLSDVLAQRRPKATLVTIHSFTPVFHGRSREVELGFLHDDDPRVAKAMLRAAPRHSRLKAALNQPYGPADGVTHTLRDHGVAGGLPNLMIEVRNDLIDTAQGVQRVGDELAAMLSDVMQSDADQSPGPTESGKAQAG